ncbi:hypothetical protein TTHERM_000770639 (macronuclear) [Tetrahymena thermophila SB210]|uniref:Uncharacterized protein n=1 Tax=Tetrahymena thermophila (strain SB210) TaxID=312017 RepID=W7XEC3_TETTS|nr:hypothetical protein TTHERM_000770639 [Tetrahymena thermophila SB210]EWS74938.1 hypothetical protein TTHERM_000770639 [Tetrahymena thermophila SB210]|eukprot:XP_012652527.1 hypothetical protein TTHERM_000770639 [Tetrahymena thermophila SB210]
MKFKLANSIDLNFLNQKKSSNVEEEESIYQGSSSNSSSQIQKKSLIKNPQIQNTSLNKNQDMKSATYGVVPANYFQQKKQQLDFNTQILKQIPDQKIFFLAGDIIVELKGADQLERCWTYSQYRNIVYMEKYSKGISLELESVYPQKDLAYIIQCLESLQDKDSYEFSEYLKIHQRIIHMINCQMLEIQKFYSNGADDMQILFNKRSAYRNAQRKQIISQRCSDNQFQMLVSISLSFQNSTSTASNIFMTHPLISILGIESETSTSLNYLKFAITKVFNNNSTKQVMFSSQKAHSQNKAAFVVKIENFEIESFDEIKIICNKTVEAIPLIYPSELQFPIFTHLNNREMFLLVNYHIDLQNIQNVMQIRRSQVFKSPQQQIFPQNYQYQNFIDYESFNNTNQNLKFLEAYYQQELFNLLN